MLVKLVDGMLLVLVGVLGALLLAAQGHRDLGAAAFVLALAATRLA